MRLARQIEVARVQLSKLTSRLVKDYTPAAYDGLKEIARLRDEEGWTGIFGPLIDLVGVEVAHHTVVEVRGVTGPLLSRVGGMAGMAAEVASVWLALRALPIRRLAWQ